METETKDTKRERQEKRPWDTWMSRGPRGLAAAGCCGTDAGKTDDGWPCAAVFKGHRFAIFAALTAMGLTFLIGFAGSILGIIAFFRTL